jgi:tungstate transport system substrate-binding protein
MYNDFVLVGPPGDPARVREAATIEDAMRSIASGGARFISRGDQSGTHEREQTLWAVAGAQPKGDRLVVAGAGMGTTLSVAEQTAAYTLSDRATFAQRASSHKLVVLFEGAPSLLNTYAVIWNPNAEHAPEAERFGSWLSDGSGRDVIEDFRVGANIVAFRLWPRDSPRAHPPDVPR